MARVGKWSVVAAVSMFSIAILACADVATSPKPSRIVGARPRHDLGANVECVTIRASYNANDPRGPVNTFNTSELPPWMWTENFYDTGSEIGIDVCFETVVPLSPADICFLQGCDSGGSSGPGVCLGPCATGGGPPPAPPQPPPATPPPPPPPPGVFQACPQSSEDDDGWNDANAIEPDTTQAGPRLCHSLSCMQSDPGIYVGAWKIPATLNIAHHTAVAEISSSRRGVTELVARIFHTGAYSIPTVPIDIVKIDQTNPYYPYAGQPVDNYAEYHWVKVAEMDKLYDFRRATLDALNQYDGNVYALSSNRFTSAVLKKAGIHPTQDMYKKIGFSPGIRWCADSILGQ